MPALFSLNGTRTPVSTGWLEAAAPTLAVKDFTISTGREADTITAWLADGRKWGECMRRADVARLLRSRPEWLGIAVTVKHGMSGAVLARDTIGPEPMAFEAWI